MTRMAAWDLIARHCGPPARLAPDMLRAENVPSGLSAMALGLSFVVSGETRGVWAGR
jgi:hypothetical protein